MKNLHLLLGLLLSLFIISCSDSVGISETSEEIDETTKIGDALELDFTTLESINEDLVTLELVPFTQDELLSRRELRHEKSCINAMYKGDLNDDETISSQDVIKALQIINEYDDETLYPGIANGDGRLNVNTEYTGASPKFWSVAHIAQLVTYDENGSTGSILDRNDVTVIIDLLIQECN